MPTPSRLVLPLLLAVCTAIPASAQSFVGDLRRELDKNDPRWSDSRARVPEGTQHPVLKWIAGRSYIVRPHEPGEGRKAELSFSPTDDPGTLSVIRRTLGTLDSLTGTAKLVSVRPKRQRGPRKRGVLLIEVTYTVAPKRGASGSLAGATEAEAETYRARYAVRAQGDALLGETSLPNIERFSEKGVSQGVAYRRTGSLIQTFTGRDEEAQTELEERAKEPIVATCWVSEFSASGEENTSPRRASLDGVQFFYNVPEEIVTAFTYDKPKHVFVIAHGWMNDRGDSLGFASKLVKGVQERAKQDGVDAKQLAFVFLSWNSKRTVFMESALCAETIGHRELAPMLRSIRSRLPQTSLTLIGHSLGGRMMLATLQGPQRDLTSSGKWRRGYFRRKQLIGGDALDAPFRRLMHIALRGRLAPAPKVHAAVLFEAAIDVDTLIQPIGVLNYGDTPDATRNVRVLANCHSINDDILRVAYTAANATTSPLVSLLRLLETGNGIQALGRLGAMRRPKKGGGRGFKGRPAEYFSRMAVAPGRVDMSALRAALNAPTAQPRNASGNRVINVDMEKVMPKAGTPKPDGSESWGAVDSHGEFFAPVSFDLIWRVTQEGVRRGAP